MNVSLCLARSCICLHYWQRLGWGQVWASRASLPPLCHLGMALHRLTMNPCCEQHGLCDGWLLCPLPERKWWGGDISRSACSTAKVGQLWSGNIFKERSPNTLIPKAMGFWGWALQKRWFRSGFWTWGLPTSTLSRDIWQCIETFLIVTAVVGVFLAPGSNVQCTGLLPQHGIICSRGQVEGRKCRS